jgi:hypothetical protein
MKGQSALHPVVGVGMMMIVEKESRQSFDDSCLWDRIEVGGNGVKGL